MRCSGPCTNRRRRWPSKTTPGTRVESVEEGYELKSEQVANALVPYRLQSCLPVGFFNAHDDDPALIRSFLDERVAHTREEFRRSLADVLTNAQSALDNAQHEQVLAVQRQAAEVLNTWIHEHPTPSPGGGHSYETLLGEIEEEAYASTVHAAVRRQGEWQFLSCAHQPLGDGARQQAVAALNRSVDSFVEHCDTLSASLPEAAELVSQAARLMRESYNELLRRIRLIGQTLYREQLDQDWKLWVDCGAEWGRGLPGYKRRVAQRHRAWFIEESRAALLRWISARFSRVSGARFLAV